MKKAPLIFLTFFLASCVKERMSEKLHAPPGCKDTLFTFDRDIIPIFNANCNFEECHDPGGEGSYDFTDYPVVANRVKAGTIQYRIDLPLEDPQHMPEEMKLSPCDYYIIEAWIQQGYPEN